MPLRFPRILKALIDGADWGSTNGGTALAENDSPTGVNEVLAPNRVFTPAERYARNVAVYTSINLIARTCGAARVRAFTRNGEEITGGAVADFLRRPAPKTTMRRVVEALVSWYSLEGTMAGRVFPSNNRAIAPTFRVLDPRLLTPREPSANPRSAGDVTKWWYFDGLHPLWGMRGGGEIPGDQVLFEATWQTQTGNIFGVSPLKVGGIFADLGTAGGDHLKQFFENGATMSGVIDIGPDAGQKQRESWSREFMGKYGNAVRKAWGWLVSSGTEVKVHPLSQELDDSFLDTINLSDEQIYRLYGVPRFLAGLQTEGDGKKAGQEIEQFYSKTVTPILGVLTEALQRDVVDRHFGDLSRHVTRPRKEAMVGTGIRKAFERAEAENSGQVLVICDSDTLPDMWKVYAERTANAKEMQEILKWSAARTQAFIGLDEEVTDEQKDVWVPSGYLNITHPEFNAKLVPGVQAGDNGLGGSQGRSESKRRSNRASASRRPSSKKSIGWPSRKARAAFLHRVRPMAMRAAEAGEPLRLADLDALAEEYGVDKRHCRAIRRALRQPGADAKELLKAYR